MMKRIIVFTAIAACAAVLSCTDSDPLPVNTKKENVLPPPAARTISVTAQMQSSTMKTADIYYHKPSTGLNYFVGTISGTSCQSFSTFTENDGETLYFFVLDGPDMITFRARAGVCALVTDPVYCGGSKIDPMYEVPIDGVNVSVGIRVVVGNGDFLLCAM